ncbi:Uu.00g092090.m01.CDS01 [Anthostomella pinea]|uniref:Uu.00g092090.m01.CDS01 n=1 Tax=Anthostomella pinea TaxID=933095 RepID=A0AAI8VNA6_9PEZI|nr:Uu.00g092090.m01.CDS01 [Anthostomella pinea]
MEYRRKQPENLPLLQRFGRWLSLKQYQIEVTFGVYMFTPTEKFIFWSVVFLLFSLTTIAVILYLPQHLLFILNRGWFYVSGGDEGSATDIAAVSKDVLSLSLSSEAMTTTPTAVAGAAGSLIPEL